jgi:hypothetical protein
MATELGFCPNCGTARTAADQKFCPKCGASLAALAAGAAASPPPTQPPPPAAPPFPPPPPASWAAGPTGAPLPPPAYPMPPSRRRSQISPAVLLLGLLLIVAVAGGAYLFANQNSNGSGASGSPATSGPVGTTPLGGNTANPATIEPGGGGSLSVALNNFSKIRSYRFSMTLAGGEFDSMLSALGAAGGAGSGPFTISGTVTALPKKAADITVAGIRMIEADGYQYVDLTGSGTFYKTQSSGSSLAEAFSPASLLTDLVSSSAGSDLVSVGSETKNGVAADHYQATTTALAEFAASQGIIGATWSSDLWISKVGGYPVGLSIIALSGDQKVVYQVVFDVTNVNDPANKITAPTTVLPGV